MCGMSMYQYACTASTVLVAHMQGALTRVLKHHHGQGTEAEGLYSDAETRLPMLSTVQAPLNSQRAGLIDLDYKCVV